MRKGILQDLWEGNHAWLLMTCFLIHSLIRVTRFKLFDWLTLPKSLPSGQMSEIPWFFINKDFISGVSSLLILAITIPLCLVFLKRCWPYSFLALCVTLCWNVANICLLVLIWFSTHNYFNPSLATTDWLTFEAYMQPKEWVYQLAHWGELLLLVSGLFLMLKTMQKQKQAEAN